LWADTDAVAATFDDIDTLALDCRFADCRHDTEPGCAVRAAVEAGELTEDRLESWRSLEREATSADRRADPRAQRAWSKSMGRMGREAMRLKGRDD
jgi:ribosome biogenesis GTPase